MVDPTSCAALDLVWDTLDATIVLGQDIIQPALRTLPSSNSPHPAPSIHASRGINHQRRCANAAQSPYRNTSRRPGSADSAATGLGVVFVFTSM